MNLQADSGLSEAKIEHYLGSVVNLLRSDVTRHPKARREHLVLLEKDVNDHLTKVQTSQDSWTERARAIPPSEEGFVSLFERNPLLTSIASALVTQSLTRSWPR